jgi:2-oxopent-4-enoate/cis-2-oxohex-4-enoate hydratase
MALEDTLIARLGDELYEALAAGRTVPNLRDRAEGITNQDAYRIQARMLERRLAAGETVVGKKIGVTSKGVQNMLGVFEPDFGILTSGMVYPDGAEIPAGTLIQPKAEGEIAFVLKRDLIGPGITAADVIAATDHVSACFEIVDSRISDWDIKIQDTIADNASCGVYVLGQDKVDPRDVDLALAGMVAERNGEIVVTGAGAAVQGSPANAVAWLANTLGRLGTPLLAGETILSGALAPMYLFEPGDTLIMRVGGIGACSISFAKEAGHA